MRNHHQPQPRRVGSKILARHYSTRQLVLHHIVDSFHRPRLLPMPLNQSPRFPFPQIAHNGEVLHRTAVGKQSPLPLPNANRHIAQWLAAFVFRLIRRHKIHLGAFPNLLRVGFAIAFPVFFGYS